MFAKNKTTIMKSVTAAEQKANDLVVSKTITITNDMSLDLKDEVMAIKRAGGDITEKDLCPVLIGEALDVRKKKRK